VPEGQGVTCLPALTCQPAIMGAVQVTTVTSQQVVVCGSRS
jgi:hypothetical protein